MFALLGIKCSFRDYHEQTENRLTHETVGRTRLSLSLSHAITLSDAHTHTLIALSQLPLD